MASTDREELGKALALLDELLADRARADAAGLSDASSLTAARDSLAQAFALETQADSAGAAPEAVEEEAVRSFPDLWQKWVGKLEQKGFFDGTEKGSTEHAERLLKAKRKFAERMKDRARPAAAAASTTPSSSSGAAAAPAAPKDVDSAQLAEAEALKEAGNTALRAKDFATARDKYLAAHSALPEGPNSHIYLANLAAALCHLGDFEGAIDACNSSIALKSDYAKSHSRLGLAHFSLGQYEESAEAYERAVEIDPASQAFKDGLQKAKAKVGSGGGNGGAVSSGGAAGMPPGMPAGMPAGLAGMMNDPSIRAMADKYRNAAPSDMGSMMSDMMSNPAMMQMAQNMMADPNAMSGIMNMMQGMGLGGAGGAGGGAGGAGGMPDLSALAGMMGGMPGGMPGMAAPAPSPAPAPGTTDSDGNLEIPETFAQTFPATAGSSSGSGAN